MSVGKQARFYTKSGLLTAERQGSWIDLNFPARLEESVEALPGLQEAQGIPLVYVSMSQFDCLVEVALETVIRELAPDLTKLAGIPVRGIIVTSQARTLDHDLSRVSSALVLTCPKTP